MGTTVLLEALMEHPVEALIVASSMSIYGEGLYRASDGSLCTQAERSLTQLHPGVWELYDVQRNALEPLPTPESKPPALTSIRATRWADYRGPGRRFGGVLPEASGAQGC
jgi:dTDP-L-rhamnose 4-epimerase